MLTIHGLRDGHLETLDDHGVIGKEVCWIDLRSPTIGEEEEVEKALGIDIPPRANLEELESSRRLRQVDGVAYLTATMVVKVDTIHPETTTITWIFAANTLITVRYAHSRALSRFAHAAHAPATSLENEIDIFVAMLETIVARQADLVEAVQRNIDEMSLSLFAERTDRPTRREYGSMLKAVGRAGELASRTREALVSIDRLVAYFRTVIPHARAGLDVSGRLDIVAHDLKALLDHVDHLAGKVTLLLDAALGLISIQQNNVIKMLSIVATIFLPPTLIASVFGMNFKYMEVLNWSTGVDLTLVAMIVAAVAPVLFFRWRGWI